MNILIVEDEKAIGELMICILNLKTTHSAILAPTIAKAKSVLEEGSFGLVIADLKLSDGSGLELLRTLASTNKGPKLCLMSGESGIEGRLTKSEIGKIALLGKPFLAAQLVAICES